MREGLRVLVVDDEAGVRSLVSAVLSRQSITVVEAASGAAAMAKLGAEEFDVALVDILLPDHSGLDVLRWIRDVDVDVEPNCVS